MPGCGGAAAVESLRERSHVVRMADLTSDAGRVLPASPHHPPVLVYLGLRAKNSAPTATSMCWSSSSPGTFPASSDSPGWSRSCRFCSDGAPTCARPPTFHGTSATTWFALRSSKMPPESDVTRVRHIVDAGRAKGSRTRTRVAVAMTWDAKGLARPITPDGLWTTLARHLPQVTPPASPRLVVPAPPPRPSILPPWTPWSSLIADDAFARRLLERALTPGTR